MLTQNRGMKKRSQQSAGKRAAG
jgi:hypothetical protein